MTFPPSVDERLYRITLALNQYPILGTRIRSRMRREVFERGILSKQQFEAEVRAAAVRSQEREGLRNPYSEEPSDIWETRLLRVRDMVTDQVFSRHLSFELFEDLVWQVLTERGYQLSGTSLAINPELAPLEVVFEQGQNIEALPLADRAPLEARLKESKVVLIRTLISDQLRYLTVAKEWFTISDLSDLRAHKIGTGRIGGKAAGMLLALRILKSVASPDLVETLRAPDSYFVGSDVFYTFMAVNNLIHWNDQKYKAEQEMRDEYPQILADFRRGQFPSDILEQFSDLLDRIGKKPLIVRSSSLLEDNFGTSFAGKYDSIFCPNQGSLAENLAALTDALTQVYASTLNPTALLYRRSRGLQDYDERMAVLIQVVEGRTFGRYYLPDAAGVAFSRNLYRWTPQIRREDGFVRLVWGLGTRAVDRVGNDYPRLVALSHPLLRPSTEPKTIRRYSQQYVDVIDLEENVLKTLPIHDVLTTQYPPLRYLAQVDEDGYFVSLRSSVFDGRIQQMTMTFDDLLRRTAFAENMRQVLRLLEDQYESPVDMEFTLHIPNPHALKPKVELTILQCRPQSHLFATERISLPVNLEAEDIIFSTRFVVPQGALGGVEYVLFVPPEEYFSLPTQETRVQLARAISRMNNALKGKQFICVGPGRWGSSNSDLGVPVDYGDIYNTRSLVELAGEGIGPAPEPSLGTHFFQDLMESQIYPLAIYLDDPKSVFVRKFFYETPSRAGEFIQADERILRALRLIRVADYHAGCSLRIVMSDEKSHAVAFLEHEEESA